ncbi:tRNA preQ1(34) S-adenosylmethionine ribosyltransferase-isomerase QueA [Anaerofustis stercorihominis]|uniref:S-adenosylmethionine:tRNA ribosyltransferase-isomerase n=3 Tax=Anaerofustis stercorihominis TaxID=214853 RepID=B1C6M9_9FIRM|nr:tRNA preQ1(34) S-adenosylmethionine ribosyltransferase-isomerase QueA [Anaerofustis stercorihominis]EDS72666.1 S-adenosylmethionine:tRNA ribosyltransferase-isomerase [Anaerofustis stercorihominis DSM 17244]MCQ4794042.1 tRNA preQ1(34) S-adenosylmethionine ribosyltransferase-isomerase QueA [Anaerofustis stercorihominis]RGD74656.1 tRNA preQ1(34) S-adenosylmethionine ribosyltransferase-isomerase QueA [Anaerofustis stercorihominis]
MKTSDFDYNLPEELIAQTPIEKRDTSRLMVVDRDTKKIKHKHFYDLIEYLNEGDTLVLNDSKVFHARLYGVKEETGAKIETFVLKPLADNMFEVMIKPAKRLKVGSVVKFDENLSMEVLEKYEEGLAKVRFFGCSDVFSYIDKIGTVPLPPYIKEKLDDDERYQTVYSKDKGSAAAPTAGLHFTNELLEKIKQKGINICYVTLHVGLGTFRPVKEDEITNHKMHSEFFIISNDTAKMINETKKNGKDIYAVGTTTVRTLESCYQKYGDIRATNMDTNIFIYPGFEFKAIDHLITNFHLPKSTLLMLISAFYNKDDILKAYKEAIKERYRFFSFGDAMLIL